MEKKVEEGPLGVERRERKMVGFLAKGGGGCLSSECVPKKIKTTKK